MQYRQLGRTGLRVPPLCLGTMTFGLQCDEATSFAIMDRALEGGIDFFDTADVYPLGGDHTTAGRTEEIIGRWMRDRGNRDRIVLASKCAGAMGAGPNDLGLSRYHIQRAVDESLRRLGTDVIDLYQVHAFDPVTPIEETLRALDDVVRSGKVRYIGCSNYPAWRLGEALATSDRLGIARYDSLQPRYNLLYRDIETELLPLARAAGLGVIVYNPLAGGFLSGKYQAGETPREGTRFTLGGAGRMYQARYWHDAQFDGDVDAARGRGAARAEHAGGGGRVGDRAAGDHVGDHRCERAGTARRNADGAGREARGRAARGVRRRVVEPAAPAGGRGLSMSEGTAKMEIAPEKAGFDAGRLSRITEHLQRSYIEPGKIAGCQTLVSRHGHVAYFSSLGLMDRERKRPMRDDTIFRIYSMTKPITSVALMTLYEQGYFQLNDPVHRVIPEWRDQRVYVSGEGESMETKAAGPADDVPARAQPHRRPLVRRDAASGRPRVRQRRAVIRGRGETLRTFVERLANVPLRYEPGDALDVLVLDRRLRVPGRSDLRRSVSTSTCARRSSSRWGCTRRRSA